MYKDLTGQRFGRLTVWGRDGSENKRIYWKCLCDCGNVIRTYTRNLTSGNIKSCGCLLIETSKRNIRGQRKPLIDLSGLKFGRLTALKRFIPEGSKEAYYECLCDCGNKVNVRAYSLKSGNTKSCGCLAKETRINTGKNSKGRLSSRLIDLTGQRFSRLVVVSRAPNGKGGRTRWNCLCDCGRTTISSPAHLRSGHTKSCGCLGLENATKSKITHNSSGTRLLRIFRQMHNRCERPSVTQFRWYGAKGIKVCDEWSDFLKFKTWALNNGYEENLTIDRIDPDKNYEPSNCRWITREENSKRVIHQKKKP